MRLNNYINVIITIVILLFTISCSSENKYPIPTIEITDSIVMLNGEFLVTNKELLQTTNNAINILIDSLDNITKELDQQNSERRLGEIEKHNLYTQSLSFYHPGYIVPKHRDIIFQAKFSTPYSLFSIILKNLKKEGYGKIIFKTNPSDSLNKYLKRNYSYDTYIKQLYKVREKRVVIGGSLPNPFLKSNDEIVEYLNKEPINKDINLTLTNNSINDFLIYNRCDTIMVFESHKPGYVNLYCKIIRTNNLNVGDSIINLEEYIEYKKMVIEIDDLNYTYNKTKINDSISSHHYKAVRDSLIHKLRRIKYVSIVKNINMIELTHFNYFDEMFLHINNISNKYYPTPTKININLNSTFNYFQFLNIIEIVYINGYRRSKRLKELSFIADNQTASPDTLSIFFEKEGR